MESNNTQKDSPATLKRAGKSRSMWWNHIKLMDDYDPRIINHVPNYTHECALCNISFSLSWSENRNKKFDKANEKGQTV